MLKLLRSVLAAVLLGGASLATWAQDGVVYHLDDSAMQGMKALRNIRNHMDVDPGVKITVVAHAQGVDFLMQGAKDRGDNAFEGPVAALAARGVKFEVCEITLKNRNLNRDQFLQEIAFTPSGVVRIAKLQRQGHAYIKP